MEEVLELEDYHLALIRQGSSMDTKCRADFDEQDISMIVQYIARDCSLVPLGEGHDNPLQCTCLENSMDRGTWGATVHGVTKSRTLLSDFTSLNNER